MEKRPADYTIYKGKAALRFTLKPGEPIEIRKEHEIYSATKTGVLFLQIAAAKGEHRYDWDNKVTLGLSETELGKIILAMEGKPQEFFHDPNMGKTQKGQVSKRLSIAPNPENTKLLCNLVITENGTDRRMPTVPIDKAEAKTIVALCTCAISKIMGWL